MRNHIFSPEMNKPAVSGNQICKQKLLNLIIRAVTIALSLMNHHECA